MRKKLKLIVIIAILVILIAGAVYFWLASDRVKTSGYQAVFLTNGQVYFGKVSGSWCRYVTLTDIYYLQLSKSLQDQSQAANADQQSLTLVKLGKEIHGPVDTMKINRQQVLFIEDLGVDSKVVQAIQQNKTQVK
jgi:hypothetical protein